MAYSSSSSSSSRTTRKQTKRKGALSVSQDEAPSSISVIWFLFLPLALFLYVFNSVQEEVTLDDPRDSVAKELYEINTNVTTFSLDEGQQASNTDQNIEIPMTGLWIYVQSWKKESIPLNWRDTFAEVNVMAHRLDAVMVEPRVRNTHLVDCESEGSLELSDIYDRKILTHNYPWLATCLDYELYSNQLSMPSFYDVCLNDDDDTEGGCMMPDGVKLESSFQAKSIDAVDSAMKQFQEDPDSIIVLRLHSVSRYAFERLTVAMAGEKKRLTALDRQKVQAYATTQFRIRENHYTYLRSQLRRNDVRSYGILHWSPSHSRTGTSFFMNCAEKLLLSKRAIDEKGSKAFFLITSLPYSNITEPINATLGTSKVNMDEDHVIMDHSRKALQKLYDRGIRRLRDILPKNEEDSTMASVLELIMVEKSPTFATCTKQCRTTKHFGGCTSCQMPTEEISAFGISHSDNLLILRPSQDLTTLPCWPETSSQVSSIGKMWKNGL